MEPVNEQKNEQKSGFLQNLKEWIRVIIIAMIIALPIRFFIAEPFIVSGASMDPTFASGQFLIVDRLGYRFIEPKRNDVIVFKYPNNPSVYYIKRIIGLPGETIKITDGKIIATNESGTSTTLDEPFIDIAHSSRDTLTSILKDDQYFVMGDNRPQSADSRVWGPLDKKLIIGRPLIRLFPLTLASFWPGEYSDKK